MSKVTDLLKEIGEKIKLAFAEGDPVPPVDSPAPTAPVAHTLKDGRVLSVTALEAGQDAIIDGAPAPAGEYELEDGQIVVVDEDGKISEVKAAPVAADPAPVDTPSQMTPEQMREMAEGFATGTVEERIAKGETIMRALMEYCFGWELREANQKAIKDQAIAVYKAGFEAQSKEDAEKIKGLEEKLAAYEGKFKAQGEVMTQILEVVTELAKVGQTDPPEGQHRRSSFAKSESAKTMKDRILGKVAERIQAK